MPGVTMRFWSGDRIGGGFSEYVMPSITGEVVLDAIHRLQAGPAPDLACRWNGKAQLPESETVVRIEIPGGWL
jgi:hypothetical protein